MFYIIWIWKGAHYNVCCLEGWRKLYLSKTLIEAEAVINID